MKRTHTSLAISLMIVSLLIGLAGGYYISPSYQQTMYQKDDMGMGEADRFVDLRYLNAMAAHHRGAILLAEQIKEKTTRPEIKALASEILSGEPKAIAELYAWKKAWYGDNRVVADPKVANLGSSDEKTDLRFPNALIAHHEAGLKMVKEIRTKSSRKEVLDNADAVDAFLTGSITMLKGWRSDWYGIE